MYLLIPRQLLIFMSYSKTFTSHYVSINSKLENDVTIISSEFTSHYVSINSPCTGKSISADKIFTSHYVSINSLQVSYRVHQVRYLHPTMYLLIPRRMPHL